MKHLSWKYVAGFIDGEGCIDFQRGYSKYQRVDGTNVNMLYLMPRIRVAQAKTGKLVIDLLHNNFGGHVVERESTNSDWQSSYSWELTNSKTRPVLQNLKRHLLIKRQQAEFLIWYIDHLSGKRVDNCPNLDRKRQLAYEEMKLLKRDPQRLSEQAVAVIAAIDAIVRPA